MNLGELKSILPTLRNVGDKFQKVADTLNKVSAGLSSSLMSNLDPTVVADKLMEVENAATEVTKVFGAGRGHIMAIKENLTASVTEVTRLGKDFKYIADTQVEISQALGRNLIVNQNLYEGLAATELVTGQGAKELTTAFKDVGFSISHITDEMETVVDVSRSLGVNARAVSTQVVQNMDYMNKFNFQNGVEGMAKMAAQATSLRVSMKDTLYFAERVYNPENAIETAAALQRLGVAQSELLDPLRLMDLSLNDPTELQNQIAEMTKQFVQLNEKGQFEIMPDGKLQLMEIAKAMQIPFDTLTKMALGGAELEEKMSRIRFPSSDKFADEETRQMIANLAEFDKKSGEYKVSFTTKEGEVVTKSVTELSPEDAELLMEGAKSDKSMTDIAIEQTSIQKRIENAVKSLSARTGYAYAATPVAEKALMAQVEVFETLTKNISKKFEIPELTKQFKKSGGGILEFLETGEMEPLKESFREIRKYFGDALQETTEQEWDKTKKSLNESTNEYIKFFSRMDFDIEKITKKIIEASEEADKEDKNKSESDGGFEGDKNKSGSDGGFGGDKKGSESDGGFEAGDLVSFPNPSERILTGEFGSFSLDKRDLIVAGDPNKMLGAEKDDMSEYINKLMGYEPKSSIQTIRTEGESKFSLDININTPSNLSKEEIMSYLERTEVIAQLKQSLNNYVAGFGKLSNSDNPIKQALRDTNEAFSI